MSEIKEAKDSRSRLRMSQHEVAKKSGISRQYYNAIENGKRRPSVTKAKSIGDVLEVNWVIFFANQVNV